jgi:hypothetical protein
VTEAFKEVRSNALSEAEGVESEEMIAGEVLRDSSGKTHYVDDDCPGGHREPGDESCVGHFRCQCDRCRTRRIG